MSANMLCDSNSLQGIAHTLLVFLNKSTHVFIFSSIHTHTPERWGEGDRQRERDRDRKIRDRETERDYAKTIKYFKKKVSMVV